MSVTKVIFLDIDGPLNNERTLLSRADRYLERDTATSVQIPANGRVELSEAAGKTWRRSAIGDRIAIGRLNRICHEAGAQIVISSTWRRFDSHDTINWLCYYGLDVDLVHEDWRTKYLTIKAQVHGLECEQEVKRGIEVREWLSRHPEVTHHAIVDDDGDFDPDQPLVQCGFRNGLLVEHFEKIEQLLGMEKKLIEVVGP